MDVSYRPYTNTAIVAMGALSLLCSVVVVTLFFTFTALSKPSFKDLNKFDFATLALDFFLSLLYGVLTFVKDPKISKYGTKTWVLSLILFTIVVTHNVVALYMHHSYVLPTIALAVPLAVALTILLVNSHFYFNEAVQPNWLDDYATSSQIEELSDFEECDFQGFVKREVKAPSDSLVKDHVSVNSDGSLNWKKTHFILAIENDFTVK